MKKQLIKTGLLLLVTFFTFSCSTDTNAPKAVTWKTYTTGDGLLNNAVGSITIDASGNVWVGYDNIAGISKFDGTAWTSNASSGLLKYGVYAVAVDAHGYIWTGNNGLMKSDVLNWIENTDAADTYE